MKHLANKLCVRRHQLVRFCPDLIVLLPAIVVLLSSLFALRMVDAADPDPPKGSQLSSAMSQSTWLTPEHKQILDLIDQGHYVRAKYKLKTKLKTVDDPLLLFALARVYHHGEGSLPRALSELRKARVLFRDRYGEAVDALPLAPWLRRMWVEEIQLLGELDRRVDQLALMREHDRRFSPSLKLQQIWPLMKLKRYDEALKLIREGVQSSNIDERVVAYNGWMALEFEQGLSSAGWRVCEEAVERVGAYSCIIAMNAAESAFVVGRFDRVEGLVSMAKRAERQDCPVDPTIHLATLYMAKGDYARASNAVRTTRAQLSGDYRLHQQFSAFVKLTTQRLLLLLGHWDNIYEHSLSMIGDPDRVGMVSYSVEAMDMSALTDHLAAIRAARSDLRIRWHYASFWKKVTLLYKQTTYALRAWYVRQQIAYRLRRSDTATRYLKPYASPIASWNLIDLAEQTGYQTVSSLREIGQQDKQTNWLHMNAYFEAMLSYGRWQSSSSFAEANQLGDRAIEHLPADELLLRQRLKLVLADIARDQGRYADYLALTDDILSGWPVAPRLYSVPISVVLSHDGALSSDEIAQFSDIIARSPLLNAVPAGEGVSLVLSEMKQPDKRTSGESPSQERSLVNVMQACFIDSTGQRLTCGHFDLDNADRATSAVAFHKALFSPQVDLSQRDIFGLDGSAVSGSADDIAKDLF